MTINLPYRIEFLLTAIVIIAILMFFVRKKYYKISDANRRFYAVLVTAHFASLANLAAAIAAAFNFRAYLIMRSLFIMLVTFMIYRTFKYIEAYNLKETEKPLLERLMLIVSVGYSTFNILSAIVPGMITSGEDNELIYSTSYGLSGAVPFLLIAVIFVYMVINRNNFERTIIAFITAFALLSLAGLAAEMGNSYLHANFGAPLRMLSFFAVSIGLTVMMFGVETPNYRKLQAAREDLERSRDEAEKARQAADNASLAKSRFLARMSHEIRTPINGIIGMNEMILNESKNDKVLKYSENIKQSAKNLLKIVNEILDFSKLESGKMKIVPCNYRMAQLVNDFCSFIPAAEAKGLKLIMNIDPNLPAVLYGDDVRVRQIVKHLVMNAIKFTDQGSITFTVKLESITDGYASISAKLTDTGRGIRSEDIPLLFKPFEQLEGKKAKTIEGTGLGLNIVDRTLQLMNSKLEVESEYGKGSTFSFTLHEKVVDASPMGDYRTAYSTKADSHSIENRNGFRAPSASVLIVDDNPINRKVLGGLLKSTEMVVEEAESGSVCLEKCREKHYDLIYLDRVMPELDGIETLKKLRGDRDGQNRVSPVICLTAASEMSEAECKAIGFSALMMKPIDPGELYSATVSLLPEEKIVKNE